MYTNFNVELTNFNVELTNFNVLLTSITDKFLLDLIPQSAAPSLKLFKAKSEDRDYKDGPSQRYLLVIKTLLQCQESSRCAVKYYDFVHVNPFNTSDDYSRRQKHALNA